MASLFEIKAREIELLDAGAGSGALTIAMVRRFCSAQTKPKRLNVTAYELDANIIQSLQTNLSRCQVECDRLGIQFSANIINEDFISSTVAVLRGDLFSPERPRFDAAIVNPPYRKLRSDSTARSMLRSVGIETSNFYGAFVALIIRLLTKGGELVAITPRSFCNGPYFTPFRNDLLKTVSLRRLHLFESRSAAFGKDNVLQENIIVHGVKGLPQAQEIIISSSSGRVNSAVTERTVPYRLVVSPDDPEQFIHVGLASDQAEAQSAMSAFPSTLKDLGLGVSTGRVVDFRAKSFLRENAESGTAPLIYPCHFNDGTVLWPKKGSRKPNAIMIHDRTRDLLVPSDVYVLVKRFSSKEERRRIVACIYDPTQIQAKWVAFENHLNYFHIGGHGLPMSLARGLAAFLNSTVIDSYFRRFSGHTQVNATDLRKLNYPPRAALESLGRKIEYATSQRELDDFIAKELL
jgi:adenine-specific DNA-methyltransferase